MRLKSIGAVAAGIGANLLAIPVDLALHAANVFPATPQEMGEGRYALALAYRAAFAVLGGWVAARLAPSSPMKHAWVLGGLGVLLASLGAAAQWGLGHHWYPLSLIALSLPATWAGGRLSTRS
jgi:hypothetical protein